MVHELKILKEYLKEIVNESKRFEIRYNDRGFQKGDYLNLIDLDGGQQAVVRVDYVFYGLEDSKYGIKPGTCVMSIHLIDWGNNHSKRLGKEAIDILNIF